MTDIKGIVTDNRKIKLSAYTDDSSFFVINTESLHLIFNIFDSFDEFSSIGWAKGRLDKPLFESFPGPLLKSGMGPLARYGNHQEIISTRLEQMYTSSDTRLEWSGEGPLFKSDSKRGYY